MPAGFIASVPLSFAFLTNHVHQTAFPRPHSFNLIPGVVRLRPEERNKYRSTEALPRCNILNISRNPITIISRNFWFPLTSRCSTRSNACCNCCEQAITPVDPDRGPPESSMSVIEIYRQLTSIATIKRIVCEVNYGRCDRPERER